MYLHVWFVTVSTSSWYCIYSIYIQLPFMGVLHISLVMLQLSVRQIYEGQVSWIWWLQDVLKHADVYRFLDLVKFGTSFGSFAHQPSPLRYIFENVPVFGDSQVKVLEDQHNVWQHLGNPIFMDVVSLGFYSHWPRWISTNLTLQSTLAITFFAMPLTF